jgi:hypothetical protein
MRLPALTDGRLPALAALLLALGGLGLAVEGLLRPGPTLEPPAGAGTGSPAEAPAPAATLPPPGPDLHVLAGSSLFGRAPAETLAAARAAAEAAATLAPPPPAEPPVPLELMGTLPAAGQTNGYAIVGTAEGQFAYRVGEALPGGAELRAVDRLGITVAHGAQEERIPLPVASSEPQAPVMPPALPPAQTVAPAAQGQAAVRPGGDAAAVARERLRKVREAQIAAARQRSAALPRPNVTPTPPPTPQAAAPAAAAAPPAAGSAPSPDGSLLEAE